MGPPNGTDIWWPPKWYGWQAGGRILLECFLVLNYGYVDYRLQLKVSLFCIVTKVEDLG